MGKGKWEMVLRGFRPVLACNCTQLEASMCLCSMLAGHNVCCSLQGIVAEDLLNAMVLQNGPGVICTIQE